MFEAYSVAVRVTLINGVANGLMNMSRAFAKTHGDAKALQRTLDQIKFQVLAGGVLAGTGLFGLHLISKTMPAAKEYARQLALMNTLGMKQADIAKVVGDAWKTTYAVPTTTAAANLATFRELRSAFGSDSEGQAHASQMLPVVGRLQGVMRSLTGKDQDHVGFDMVKAIELRTGVMTTAALERNADLMSRAIIGMGGTVTVSDFHGAMKMGKMATNKWSDDFAYNYLPTLMQELKTAHGGGAQSAGTILMSLYQQMHGKMTKAAMPLWIESGLVRPQDVVKNATGSWQMKPGAVRGTDLFETNPYLWVQQYLRPAVDKLAAAKHITPETAINAMFSNRNAAFGAYNMYVKAAQYDRDKLTITRADGGYQAYAKLLKSDPTLAQAALAAQWQNILAQIGFSIMPTLVAGTLKLIDVLKTLSGWMHEHPRTVKVLTAAFAGLSGVLVFSGSVLMISGAFKAVGLALKVFQVAKLFQIARGVTTVGGAISAAASQSSMSFTVANALTSIFGAIATGAAILANVAIPVLGFAAMGVGVNKALNYQNVLKNPGAASPQELQAALAYAHANAENYRGQLAKGQINPATGKAFLSKWEADEQALRSGGGSPYVAARNRPQDNTKGIINMDGKKVGEIVWGHQADAMARQAFAGGSAFDGGMNLATPGMRY